MPWFLACKYISNPPTSLSYVEATYRQRRVNLGLAGLLALLAFWLVLPLRFPRKLVGDGALVFRVESLVGVLLALLEAVSSVLLALWDVLLS